MRVLIAGDSVMTRRLGAAAERLGHDCRLAADGESALTTLDAQPADVLISHWPLPGDAGRELCRRLRANPDAPYTYLAIVVSPEHCRHGLDALEAGADGYLTEPVDLLALQGCLLAAERVLALHRRREALARIGRRLRQSVDEPAVYRVLVDEALRIAGGGAATGYRWDAEQGAFIPCGPLVTLGITGEAHDALATARVAQWCAALNAGAQWPRPAQQAGLGGLPGVIEIALAHEERLLGLIVVSTRGPAPKLTAGEQQLIDLLGDLATGTLVGIEQTRLRAMAASADELAHRVNNDLQRAVLALEILQGGYAGVKSADLLARTAKSLEQIRADIGRLQRLSRLRADDSPAEARPTLPARRASRRGSVVS